MSQHKKNYPYWLDRSEEKNLREVGRWLYVGADVSPWVRPMRSGWRVIVDLYGLNQVHRIYESAEVVLCRPFDDGATFPPGLLDEIEALLIEHQRHGRILLHCQAGLSRSASAAYAMLRRFQGLTHKAALKRVRVPKYPEYPRKETLASARAWVEQRKKRRR